MCAIDEVKPTLPCGAFYHGVPDNKCDDVNYPNTTVMEILGDLEVPLHGFRCWELHTCMATRVLHTKAIR